MRTRHGARLWILGSVVVAVIVTAAAYLLFIGPQRDAAAAAQQQTITVQENNRAARQHLGELREQSQHLDKYRAEYERARRALPAESGMPEFLRMLQSLGRQTLVTVSALTVGTPTAVSASPPPDTPASSAPSDASDDQSTASDDQSTASDGRSTANGAPTEPGALAGVYSLALSAQVSGTVAQLNAFLTQLQSVQPRALRISAITESIPAAAIPDESIPVGSSTSDAQANMSLTMTVFVRPEDPIVAEESGAGEGSPATAPASGDAKAAS